jgi:hypothetical protein
MLQRWEMIADNRLREVVVSHRSANGFPKMSMRPVRAF